MASSGVLASPSFKLELMSGLYHAPGGCAYCCCARAVSHHRTASSRRRNVSHLSQLKDIRERARKQIMEGAVTADYALNRDQAIGILNEALATELVCVARYKFHYFMATGIHSQAVKEEFKEHADEEQEHADWLAERIKQLGGKPEMNPAVVTANAHSEYKEGSSLADMIREDLVAERIAIETD